MSQAANRWLVTRTSDGSAYDAAYEGRAAAGENVQGKADFLHRLGPTSVLDAGCGTGRVGRELARRGLDIVGVDIDPEMLATAREKAPGIEWQLGDIAVVDLSRQFDAIVLPTETEYDATTCADIPATGRGDDRPRAERDQPAHARVHGIH